MKPAALPIPGPHGLLDQLEQPVLAFRRDGTLVYLNRQARALLPAVDQPVGHTLRELFPSVAELELHRCFQRVASSGRSERAELADLGSGSCSFDSHFYVDGELVWVVARPLAPSREGRPSEQRLRLTPGAMGDLLYEWDLATGRLSWNDAFADSYLDPRAPVGPDFDTVMDWARGRLHPDDVDRVMRTLEACRSGAVDLHVEFRLRRLDGTYGHLLDRAFVVRDASGRPLRLVGALHDCTDEEQALVTHRAATERLALLAYLSRELAHGANQVGTLCERIARRLMEVLGDACTLRLVSADGRLLELVGLAATDVPTETAIRALGPVSIEECMGGEAVRQRRVVVIRLDGDPVPYLSPALREVALELGIGSLIAAPMLMGEQVLGVLTVGRRASAGLAPFGDEDGVLLEEIAHRVGLAVHTATSLERAERASAQLQQLTDALPALIAVVDRDRRYRFVSRAYEAWHQRPRTDFVDQRVEDVVGPALWQQVGPLLDRALAGEELQVEIQPHRQPYPSDLRITYLPQRGPSGEVQEVIILTFDITELRQADRRKDEFLALLGHELRNPLAPILTALELMKLRGTTDDGNERAVIERQVRHMVQLVDDLLDISRITRGTIQLRPTPCAVSQVLARAVEMASPLFEKRAHRLRLHVLGPGLSVMGDPGRLAQVFSNLLTNAAKFTDHGGQIDVEAKLVGDLVRVVVSDTGMGISPEVLPTLFEPFVQGPRALDRAHGGLGLGLPLVKSLVELHGGRVSASSGGPLKGSAFVVELPAADGVEEEMPVPQLSLRRPPEPGRRVLVVDDNPDAADVLAEALRDLGHEVEVAHDGPRALELAERFFPEVGILDIGLPVMDGYELARRLRRLGAPAALRLIAVTGYGQDTDRELSLHAGFDLHLVKPVDLVTLLAGFDP